MPGYLIYLVSVAKIIRGQKDIVSDGLSSLYVERSAKGSSILLM